MLTNSVNMKHIKNANGAEVNYLLVYFEETIFGSFTAFCYLMGISGDIKTNLAIHLALYCTEYSLGNFSDKLSTY